MDTELLSSFSKVIAPPPYLLRYPVSENMDDIQALLNIQSLLHPQDDRNKEEVCKSWPRFFPPISSHQEQDQEERYTSYSSDKRFLSIAPQGNDSCFASGGHGDEDDETLSTKSGTYSFAPSAAFADILNDIAVSKLIYMAENAGDAQVNADPPSTVWVFKAPGGGDDGVESDLDEDEMVSEYGERGGETLYYSPVVGFHLED